MEVQLKEDVLQEIRKGDGRFLLHDEVETKPGSYEIIPIWETVEESDVMTPREMYEGVIKDNYQVDYARMAIVSRTRHSVRGWTDGDQTDEQAPLPGSLQVLVGRVVKGLQDDRDFVYVGVANSVRF